MTVILVTASSRHGATREITDAIAAGLERRGLTADARPLDDLDGIAGYDAVVLGSAVYMGRWLGPARAFADANADALSAVPVWLFSSGPLGSPDHLVPEDEPADVVELSERVGARGHVVFAGRLDHASLNRRERLVTRFVKAADADCRDWDAIDAFSGAIADQLATNEVGLS